jgi:hypothetical protein
MPGLLSFLVANPNIQYTGLYLALSVTYLPHWLVASRSSPFALALCNSNDIAFAISPEPRPTLSQNIDHHSALAIQASAARAWLKAHPGQTSLHALNSLIVAFPDLITTPVFSIIGFTNRGPRSCTCRWIALST